MDEVPVIKLDFGCGPHKREGYFGVDSIQFEGVDLVFDLTQTPYPWEDNSVDEIHSSHFVEHLTNKERILFFNECYRILKPKGKMEIITPHWSHERAYGDPTHQWPPVTSWMYFYLNADWRKVNAPHVGYTCDFDYNLIGTHDPNDVWVAMRNQETKGILMTRNINTVTDLIAHLTKK